MGERDRWYPGFSRRKDTPTQSSDYPPWVMVVLISAMAAIAGILAVLLTRAGQ